MVRNFARFQRGKPSPWTRCIRIAFGSTRVFRCSSAHERNSDMRIRSLAIPAVALVVAGATVLPASANHSWGNYHWARSGAVQLNIYSSVTSDWSGNLSTANSDWNQSQYLQNTVVNSATDTTTRSQCAMPTGAIRVCNYTYGNTGWSGLASINTGRG